MSIKNKRNILCITAVLILLLMTLFVSSKIFANQTEIKNDVIISGNIQKETADKIEGALKGASIPFRLETNSDNTYDLIVQDKYKAFALITLSFAFTSDYWSFMTETKHPVLADELLFDVNTIDTLIFDYCNKLSKYIESKDRRFENLSVMSERALGYYISKQLLTIEGVSDVSVLILHDGDQFNFMMHIDTIKTFNDSDMHTIRQFLEDNINGIIIEQENNDENGIYFGGLFEWELPEQANEIMKIEYDSINSDVVSIESPAEPEQVEPTQRVK